MDQHRVAVFLGAEEIEIRNDPAPGLRAGEALVRLRSCGLCTMEQRLWQGRQTDYPIMPGHEAAGQVVEIHPETILDLSIGDRVAVAFLDRCMQCASCRRGDTHLCTGKLKGRQKGKLRRIGGLADYAALPAWKLFPMPSELGFDEIAMSEPLACVVHSVHKANLRFGDDVLVIGCGTMGQMHVILSFFRGARVFVSEPDPERRALALVHGAAGAIDPENAVDEIRSITRGKGVDAVFVTSASQETADQAAAAVRDGGRIIYYGSFADNSGFSLGPQDLRQRGILLDGARGQTLSDWAESTRLLANRIVDVTKLISANYSLDDLGDALRHAVDPSSFRIMINM
jgi:threonine dehydrogenase-like Zn-dependent dehydrogenase